IRLAIGEAQRIAGAAERMRALPDVAAKYREMAGSELAKADRIANYGDEQTKAYYAQQVKTLLDESPDTLVTLPGSDTPMTTAKALELAQRDADEVRFDADLVKAAAECALMNAL
ncbi:MAG: hypothetical protein ACRCV9_01480, partial [Burkholderiaceae bacterium]